MHTNLPTLELALVVNTLKLDLGFTTLRIIQGTINSILKELEPAELGPPKAPKEVRHRPDWQRRSRPSKRRIHLEESGEAPRIHLRLYFSIEDLEVLLFNEDASLVIRSEQLL